VAGPTIQTDAYILQKAPPKETFQPLTAFSAEHGLLRILHRMPRKPTPSHVPLDMFDHVALMLEAGNGGIWFVKEARHLQRHEGIFAALIIRNQVHEDSRDVVEKLLTTAFAAFAQADRPDIVGFKSFYCFARDEGYPLKQQWFPTLAREDRADVSSLLNLPLSAQTLTKETVARLFMQLEGYLKGHTDILVD
jgi:hypothetical protein